MGCCQALLLLLLLVLRWRSSPDGSTNTLLGPAAPWKHTCKGVITVVAWCDIKPQPINHT
jgi:hypothetical protein